jgi:hypothetical protein
MSNEVYANGREISCKSAAGKSIAAFPDVCLTPPPPPAGPLPIPYPNTGEAADTTDGSKSVQISDKEIMLKDKSCFSKSTGDEAATKGQGMGVVTHQIQGKVYFSMWSMDVQVEGENVCRHLDMTTHNHASMPSNTTPWPYADAAMVGKDGVCEGMDHLKLQPYSEKCPPATPGGDPETGHHLIPGRCLGRAAGSTPAAGYNHDKAPVICVSRGNQHQGSHRRCHAVFDPVEQSCADSVPPKPFTYDNARNTAAKSAGGAMSPPRDLSPKEQACVGAQLDNYYTQKPPDGPGCTPGTNLRASGASGKVVPEPGEAPW